MGRYAVRRLAQAVVTLFGLCLVTFLIFTVLPSGDPAVAKAGRGASPAVVAEVRHDLGLDEPWPRQFGRFVSGLVLHGDIGHSYQTDQDVDSLVLRALPATASLVLGAAVLWLALAIPVGVWAGARPGGVFDRIVAAVSLTTASIPVYVVGLGLLYLLGNDVGRFHVLPGVDSYVGFTRSPTAWFRALVLPWVTLAVPFFGFYARLISATVRDTLPLDFVRTARAKGLSESRILLRHVLREAMTPVVTALGMDVGLLLGGAALVEVVFGIPGVGRLSLDAVRTADLPTIQGVVLCGGIAVLLINLAVDLWLAQRDRRIELVAGA